MPLSNYVLRWQMQFPIMLTAIHRWKCIIQSHVMTNGNYNMIQLYLSQYLSLSGNIYCITGCLMWLLPYMEIFKVKHFRFKFALATDNISILGNKSKATYVSFPTNIFVLIVHVWWINAPLFLKFVRSCLFRRPTPTFYPRGIIRVYTNASVQ